MCLESRRQLRQTGICLSKNSRLPHSSFGFYLKILLDKYQKFKRKQIGSWQVTIDFVKLWVSSHLIGSARAFSWRNCISPCLTLLQTALQLIVGDVIIWRWAERPAPASHLQLRSSQSCTSHHHRLLALFTILSPSNILAGRSFHFSPKPINLHHLYYGVLYQHVFNRGKMINPVQGGQRLSQTY